MTPRPPLSEAGRLLEHLAAMTNSIEQALSALSVHSLSGIEESLWIQETLSTTLRRAVHDLRHVQLGHNEAEAIRRAVLRLLDKNRCYELLVREASHTNSILQAVGGSSHPRHLSHQDPGYGSLSYEI